MLSEKKSAIRHTNKHTYTQLMNIICSTTKIKHIFEREIPNLRMLFDWTQNEKNEKAFSIFLTHATHGPMENLCKAHRSHSISRAYICSSFATDGKILQNAKDDSFQFPISIPQTQTVSRYFIFRFSGKWKKVRQNGFLRTLILL